jgi:FkbM family methyltransferase
MSAQIEWDWSLTAEALNEVDVLVAPDCGVAHLAAAMGVPTFVMLSAYADWRWGASGSTTPWYPAARLFRQRRIGDWAPVVEEVAAALAEIPVPSLCDTAYGKMFVLPHDVPRGIQIASTGQAPDHDDIVDLCGRLAARRNGKTPVVLDVGANFGCFSLALAKLGASVHAFEPQPLFADFLRASAKLNGLRIAVHADAVGAEIGTIFVPEVDYMKPRDFGMTKLSEVAGRAVRLVSIDEMGLGYVDLIKIDVEGMEADVLLGARRTIEESRPLIFLEWNLSDPALLRRMLDDLGYAIVREGERDWLCEPR